MKNNYSTCIRRTSCSGLAFVSTGMLFVSTSLAQMDPDENFEARCNAPGVTLCASFDSQSSTDMPGRSGQAQVDTEIKASGEGSMYVDVCGNCPSAPGYIATNMGAEFGANSSLYIQWRQRFDQNMIDVDLGGEGFKQMVLYDQSPGGNIEVAMLNLGYNGFPQAYTAMGGAYMRKPQRSLQGSTLMWNEEEDICTTSDMENCLHYKPDEWMTFYYEQEIGDWGEANTRIKISMSGENEPLQTFITYDDWTFEDDGPDSYQRTIWLGPFSLGRSGSGFEDAQTWIDELIISTEPIADPYQESTDIHKSPFGKDKGNMEIKAHFFEKNSFIISFANKKKNANVSIYDIKGKEVERFAGLKDDKVEWNASKMQKGIYLVQVESDDQNFNQKLVLTH